MTMTKTPSIDALAARSAVLEDERAVRALVTRMGTLVDRGDWPACEEMFHGPVHADWSAVCGAPATEVRPAELVGGWRASLSGLETTQYLTRRARHPRRWWPRDLHLLRHRKPPPGQRHRRIAVDRWRALRPRTRPRHGWLADHLRRPDAVLGIGHPARAHAGTARHRPWSGVVTTDQVHPVSFSAGQGNLCGTLFLPSSERHRAPYPAVVNAGSWTTVRGQIADRYAAAMAERGFEALSFDFTGYGASDGFPQDVEDPDSKADGLVHALASLAEHDLIDERRLGSLGLCASVGYAALAAAKEPRCWAVAMVAPRLHDAALVREIYGGEDGGREQRHERTGEVDYVPAQSPTDPLAAMPMSVDFYENPDRGAIPEWSNRFAVPTLIVHSPDAAIPDDAQRFHDALTVESSLICLEGTQLDFYDAPGHVTRAADLTAEHLAG